MSRSPARTSNSVSLFPFLAVLVCAMGALIFLLLVTTRRIRHNAVLKAVVEVEAPPEQPIVLPVDVPIAVNAAAVVPASSPVAAPVPSAPAEAAPDPNAKLKELIAALRQRREEEQRRVEERRRLAAAAKSKLAETETRLSQLSKAFKQKQEERLTVSVNRQVVRAELTKLGEEIEQAHVALRQLEQQDASHSTKFEIVPFDGRSGTTRRPILIECTKDGLTFLEERISLGAGDVDGFTVQYNPLKAGTQALVNFRRAQLKAERDARTDPEPYILLIVRPGGAIAYYAARRMLSDLEQQTGYELVQADRELALPAADPQAVAVCRRAIDSVLSERRKVIEALTSSRGASDGLLRFRRGPGGMEPVEEEQSIFERAGKPGFGERNRIARGGGHGGGRPTGSTGRFGSGRREYRRAGRGGDGPGRDGMRSQGERGSPGGGVAAGDWSASGNRGDAGATTPTDGRRGTEGGGGVTSNRASAAVSRPVSTIDDGAITGVPGVPSSFGEAGGGAAGDTRGTAQKSNGAGEGLAQGNAGNAGRASGRSGPGGSAGAAAGTSAKPPLPLRTFGQSGGSDGKSGNGSSGGGRPSRRAWGVGSVRSGIGFERETVIHVGAEEVRVGRLPAAPIARFKSTDQMIERVLDDLERHARTWGPPPKNFYWVPVVRFIVSPGGNQFYERLHGPLRKAGIGSTVEYPLE